MPFIIFGRHFLYSGETQMSHINFFIHSTIKCRHLKVGQCVASFWLVSSGFLRFSPEAIVFKCDILRALLPLKLLLTAINLRCKFYTNEIYIFLLQLLQYDNVPHKQCRIGRNKESSFLDNATEMCTWRGRVEKNVRKNERERKEETVHNVINARC